MDVCKALLQIIYVNMDETHCVGVCGVWVVSVKCWLHIKSKLCRVFKLNLY